MTYMLSMIWDIISSVRVTFLDYVPTPFGQTLDWGSSEMPRKLQMTGQSSSYDTRLNDRMRNVSYASDPQPISLPKRRVCGAMSSTSTTVYEPHPSSSLKYTSHNNQSTYHVPTQSLLEEASPGGCDAHSHSDFVKEEAQEHLEQNTQCTVCGLELLDSSSTYVIPWTAPHIIHKVNSLFGDGTNNHKSLLPSPVSWVMRDHKGLEFCRPCFSNIHRLHLCWACGDVISRKEERISCGWRWWHWGCVACVLCRTPVAPPQWYSKSIRSDWCKDGDLNDKEQDVQDVLLDLDPVYPENKIHENQAPICKSCKWRQSGTNKQNSLQCGISAWVAQITDGATSDIMPSRPHRVLRRTACEIHSLGETVSQAGKLLYLDSADKVMAMNSTRFATLKEVHAANEFEKFTIELYSVPRPIPRWMRHLPSNRTNRVRS